jgi:parvulin-like peptidyl-prolyl isomerase
MTILTVAMGNLVDNQGRCGSAARMHRTLLGIAGSATALVILPWGPAGCSSPASRPPATVTADNRSAAAGAGPTAAAAAMVDGSVVTWPDLHPGLAELGGQAALREAVLDLALERALRNANLEIPETAVTAERTRMAESLSDDPDTAENLMRSVRRRSGLGPHRFKRLLWRNAALRALVADRVQVTETAVANAHDAAHGPRRRCRLLSVATLREARAARDRIAAGTSFADVAVDVSTDASASRGGLLAPFSREDPSYPKPLREAAWNTAPGTLTNPVLVNGSYVVLEVIEELPGDGVGLESARPRLERAVRLAQERLLMDDLAQRLVGSARVVIFDESLQYSWEQ